MKSLQDKFGGILMQSDHLQLGRCPHCHVADPVLAKKTSFTTKNHAEVNARDWAIYVCGTCGGVITTGGPHGAGGIAEQVYPTRRELDAAIPDRARTYLTQAIETIHAPAGSVMLSASAVDAMLQAQGYVGETLYARIEKAAKDHIITSEMAKWAHDVRLDANDQRHSEETAPLPDSDTARKCVEFATALAELMFVLPARVERGRKEAEGLRE